ncbi:hypothetical protein GVAV_002015 [Gurleya vavrai]
MIKFLIFINYLLNVIHGASAVESQDNTENPLNGLSELSKNIMLTARELIENSDYFIFCSDEIQSRKKALGSFLYKTGLDLSSGNMQNFLRLFELFTISGAKAIQLIIDSIDDYILKNSEKQTFEKLTCLQDLKKVFLTFLTDDKASDNTPFLEPFKEIIIFDSMFENEENITFVTYCVFNICEFDELFINTIKKAININNPKD